MAKSENYERIELIFAKDNAEEMELYRYIIKKSKLLGRNKYIKLLILDDMKKGD